MYIHRPVAKLMHQHIRSHEHVSNLKVNVIVISQTVTNHITEMPELRHKLNVIATPCRLKCHRPAVSL